MQLLQQPLHPSEISASVVSTDIHKGPSTGRSPSTVDAAHPVEAEVPRTSQTDIPSHTATLDPVQTDKMTILTVQIALNENSVWSSGKQTTGRHVSVNWLTSSKLEVCYMYSVDKGIINVL